MKKSCRIGHSAIRTSCKFSDLHAILMPYLHYWDLYQLPFCSEKTHNFDHLMPFRSFFTCLFMARRPIVPINEDCVFCRESITTTKNASSAAIKNRG